MLFRRKKREQKLSAQEEAERRLRLYRTVFDTEHGREVLAELVDISNFVGVPQSDADEGKRWMVMYILDAMGIKRTRDVVDSLMDVLPEQPEKQEEAE